MRGGEKVLLEFCRLFPQAEVHTLVWKRGSVAPEIEQRVRGVSFLDRLPGAARLYRNYLPLFPAAVRSLRVGRPDLVVSSSHAVAKGVPVPEGIPHVCYIHTPMRYIWEQRGSYFRSGPGDWVKRLALAAAAPRLRRFDLDSARRVDHFIANSETVRERVRRLYHRDAEVIYPPVDVDFFRPAAHVRREDFYLVVSSLEPYKRIDLAIEAFRALGRPLVVAGSGTERKRLEAQAPDNVRFLGRVSDLELLSLYRRCRALIFPGLEDFGMTAVEAHACSAPVICYAEGGVTETVVDSDTGVWFEPRTSAALAAAVLRFEKKSRRPERIRARSLRFSRREFRARMGAFLRSRLGLSLER